MHEVERIRRFNRTITRRLGALDSSFLGRRRSLGACRVLYEIGADGTDIRSLRDRLGLDSGYASRLVGGLEREGLVKVSRSRSDARVRTLALTRAGLRELALLNEYSDQQAAAILEPLSAGQKEALVSAMDTVERLYRASSLSIDIEDPRSPAAVSCIESYCDELARRFEKGFDPGRSISANPGELVLPHGCLVVAKVLGEPVGCGAIKLHGDIAEVKRMWVSPGDRGAGIGGRILSRLEDIAREHGAGVLHLETNESLTEAQAMYRKHGYEEVEPFSDEPYAHHWFEKRL